MVLVHTKCQVGDICIAFTQLFACRNMYWQLAYAKQYYVVLLSVYFYHFAAC